MKNIKSIIIENLISLRKTKGYTQMELAKKINYSDKAVSRWENGEVTPDVETLQTIADVYGVDVTYLMEKHDIVTTGNAKSNTIATEALAIFIVWTIATVCFVYSLMKGDVGLWQLFVWAVPCSCLVGLYFERKYWHNKTQKSVIRSLFCWTLLASIYLQFLSENLWLIFIIGIPVQVCLVIATFIKNDK